jgi:hypothetical protein
LRGDCPVAGEKAAKEEKGSLDNRQEKKVKERKRK